LVMISTRDPGCIAKRRGLLFFVAICSPELGGRYTTTLSHVPDNVRINF
jgi:hypothetical protein